MNTLLQDLRYALRMLLKNPGFTVVAVLALALGIGANTAIFSVVSAVLLRPLPFPEPERLVALWSGDTQKPDSRTSSSYPDFADWRASNTVLESVAAFGQTSFTLTERGREAMRVPGTGVSADLFRVLRAQPTLGRAFLPTEDEPGSRVAIISHALWQRRFGGDKEVLGRTVTLDKENYQIVGVMPAGFRFPVQNEPAEIWITLAAQREVPPGGEESTAGQRGNHMYWAIGRLKTDVSVEQAQANLSALAATLAQQFPDTNKHFDTVRVRPLLSDLTGDVRPALWVLLGAAGCVLLIACVNVANLLLARATARQKEIGVRAALGAGRARLVRQLLTESLLLALLGGAAGSLLALWGTEGVAALLPANFPRAHEITPDARVLAFTAGISLLTGVLFGLAPAWRMARPDLALALNESAGRGSTENARGRRLRGGLVVAEMVLTFVLLVGAGLLIRSFWQLQRVPPGFDPQGIFTVNLALPDSPDPQALPRVANFYKQLLERAAALPSVRTVSAVTPLPLSGAGFRTGFDIAGRLTSKGDRPLGDVQIVLPDYFRTMSIPLLSGRDFDARDGYGAPGAIIISEALARKYFPDENPLGKKITPQISFDVHEPIEREIVGVVADVKLRKLTADANPTLYVPHAQLPDTSMTLVVRTAATDGGDPQATLLPALRNAVATLDKELPLYRPRMMEDYLADAVAQPRLNMALLVIFAAVAATLTAVGIYGVMAYSVAQRTQEIGIRLALGAQKNDVLRLVVGQGLRLTFLGILLGLLAAGGLARLLASLLYGVGASDPPTFGAIALLLTIVALVACYLPARRATRVDPMVALRET